MKMTLIYPRWPKLERQTEFHLPPHGPVVFAAAVPEEIELEFVDENRQTVDFDQCGELVALSVMLTAQLPRAFEIAAEFRARQVPVIFGGIAVMLHSEEVALHADAVFLGEAEGRFQQVIDDFRAGRLRKLYDYMGNPPDISLVGTARRDILKRDLYNYRGVQMLDLVHASRGCKFNCFPCCTGYLGGRRFRPRPIDKVIEELESIRNNRLFVVDNSLAQDRQWLKELFTAMAPLKKKWVSHPILDDDEILKLAADAGAREAAGVDYVVLGYCEGNVAELFRRVAGGERPAAVLDGRGVAAADIPPIRRPALLGAAEVSRGCGMGCGFCALGRAPMEHLPADTVLSDLETNLAGGARSLSLSTEDLFRYGARGMSVRPEALLGLLQAVRRVAGGAARAGDADAKIGQAGGIDASFAGRADEPRARIDTDIHLRSRPARAPRGAARARALPAPRDPWRRGTGRGRDRRAR